MNATTTALAATAVAVVGGALRGAAPVLAAAALVAAALLCGGCSVATDPPGAADADERRQFAFRIDASFTAEQADAIRLGMAFWAGELPLADVVEFPGDACAEGGPIGCFVALPAGHEVFTAEAGPMPPDGRPCIGRYLDGWIAMRADLGADVLPIVAAHEFGHRLGLWHTSRGVMSETVSADTSWHLNPKAIRLLEHRGWR